MKRVLVAPLDWGLGHTARCIPVITEFQKQGATVFFAGTEQQIVFVKQHIKSISATFLFGYNVSYSAIWPQWIKIGFQSLRLMKLIEREQRWLEDFVKNNRIDIVISDNRFGLHTKSCKSIFITHQLNIPSPLFKQKATDINLAYIDNFDECWIPDDPKLNVSGILSKNEKYTTQIGLLSRFKKPAPTSETTFDFLFLISGTEPQRSIFQKKLLALAANNMYSIALVQGVNEIPESIPASVTSFGILNSEQLEQLVQQCETVVCRSGYSSIMDLVVLQKKMFLIPTPGQPEQEYLAAHLHKKFGIPYCLQKNIPNSLDLTDVKNMARIIPKEPRSNVFNPASSENLLGIEIRRILNA